MSNGNRRLFIAGNWKMNKTVAESLSMVRELANLVSQVRDRIEIAVAPPFTALYAVARQLDGTNIAVAGQDLYWEDAGAFTSQVSGPMLYEAGARIAIIGHSERRQFFGETDATVTDAPGRPQGGAGAHRLHRRDPRRARSRQDLEVVGADR